MLLSRLCLPACCSLLVCWLLVASPGLNPAAAQEEAKPSAEFSAEQIEFFEREVRPLLVKRCYECHGDVGDELKGGLRLDSRGAILKGGDTGPSLDLAEPENSLLLDAVRYGSTYQMPPKSKMPAEEIAVFEKWIKAKAPWPAESKSKVETPKKFDLAARKASHWAWQPIQSPSAPNVGDSSWPQTAIDRFVLAKLDAAKLQPAPVADKRVLARRLYYDLTGLPPPFERVDTLVKDESPDAVEKLVDELLKSPQFGERWARHWLDVVAYAETRGHEFDYDIPGAPLYRDYVIKSLNEDMPFDQFAMEHIAGDLIDRKDGKGAHESAIATGFWFLGEWLHSPVDIRKDEADRFDRMIDVYSKSFLGLTVSCARCHDHKFDAISQKDYYALSGFLQSMEYRQYRFETNDLERQAATEITDAETALQTRLKEHASQAIRKAVTDSEAYMTAALRSEKTEEGATLDSRRLAAWKKELEGTQFTSTQGDDSKTEKGAASVRIVDEFSNPQATLMQDGFAFGLHPQAIGTVLLSGNAAEPIAGIRTHGAAGYSRAFSKLAIDAKQPRDFGVLGSTVRSGKTLRTKAFVLKQPVLHYLVRGAGRAFAAVDSHRAVAGPLHGGLVSAFPEQENAWRWVRHELKDYVGHNLHVEFTPDKETGFEVAMVAEGDSPPFALTDAAPLWKRAAPQEFRRQILEILDAWAALKERETLASEQAGYLDSIVRRRDLFPLGERASDELRAAIQDFQTLQDRWKEKMATPSRTVTCAIEGDAVDEDLLIRGNTRVIGDRVPRAFLTGLRAETQSAYSGAGRLELARSTISKGNPLFARVAVNRVWHHLFGKGIVPTVDNFGVLGLPPSHPELLDHLATEFVADGYSLKRLIKRIVLSKTYQQGSQHRAEADAIDPKNELLHRMNLRRRDAEGIRDGILALSGRLDLKGPEGESVPVHLTPYMDGRGRPSTSGPLDGDGKRSLYLAVRRNFPSPLLSVFDFPTPAAPFGARNQSNVPAQALALLNDPFVHQQAKRWADVVLKVPGSFEARIDLIYQRALSRKANLEEIEVWKAFCGKQAELLGAKPEESLTDPRLWLDVCHLMFNSKAFLFVE